ncbi:haloacid dehalogenase-like hydrolase [Deltaproteobacteria bacterium OttesenSCG-928-M10]|nr:haloacid dehalogenase-like hydrolase [Deltaproteobacteria bacterium OttesenSCG-928-M10]
MDKPVIALMYDFDKTLCTKDMQEYSFIPKINMAPKDFWSKTNSSAKEQKMDKILSYMHFMLKEAKSADQRIRREDFVALGQDLEYFPGVEKWFSRISDFVKDMDVAVEHYVISSGLKEIIEGSSIYGCFKEVFASEFLYDVNEVACWPKNALNYTTKTQFLFRINKGVLDLSNDEDLNRYTPDDDRPVPFRNMLYIGDGLTDVPCMKLVKANGGYSVAVYQDGEKGKVEDLIIDKRVDFLALADYSENGELDKIVKDIILKMVMVDSLKEKSKRQIAEIKQSRDQNLHNQT